jgi:competence protein ComEC
MLCLSAMVLLLFRPQLIFEVGFQLSYAAVFAIIMLYPVFSKVYQPELKVLKIFTDTAYLSLAAQIGVLPFQLYYFHQFPGLFLIGNLVIIPFLGVLLFGGIFCITLALFGTLFSFFVEVYSYVLDLLLNYVDWLSQFEEFIFKDLFFTQSMFLTSILSVITFMVMMREFRKSRIILFLVSILSFLMLSVFEISNIQSNTELVIFHKTGRTLLGVKQAEKLKVYSDSISRQENSYLIKNYSLLNRVKQTKTEALKNIYKLQEQRLIVIDSSGIYASNPKGQIVALSGSPEVHLGKLIQALKPKQIIADGNNYKSYVERWRKTSRKHGVSFYSTYENGAISFKLD